MKEITQMTQQYRKGLEQSYKKIKHPLFTLNGIEYEVINVTEEEMSTADYFILKSPDNYPEVYYQTKVGKAKENEKILRSSGLGKYIDKHTLDSYQTLETWQKMLKQKATNFIENPKGWFVVLGASGSGKTHLCNALAISLMRQGHSLKYMLWFDEINKIKYNMDHNEQFIKEMTNPDILYIDDFLKTRGTTEPTDIEIELAFQVLDSRYREEKITIISSEKTSEDLKKYDTAVYGRIIEMAGDNLFVIQRDSNKNWRERMALTKKGALK